MSTRRLSHVCGLIRAQSASLILSLCVYTGCATAYSPPPLTVQHPAHPEAVAAPESPRSSTLAYGPADLPAPQPASIMAQQSESGTPPAAQGSQPAVVGEGTVIAVVPGSSQLVVDHKEIPGFMGAMTMGYRTEPPALLADVKPGDLIRFTIDAQRQVIIRIEKLHK